MRNAIIGALNSTVGDPDHSAVIEALGFAGNPLSQAGREWLGGLVRCRRTRSARGRTVRCWVGPGRGRSAPPNTAGCVRCQSS